jgi:hypothetical protein
LGLVLGSALLGAAIGGMTAHRRGGRPADIAQYAAAFGIAFALLGLIATIALSRIILG